MQENDFYFTAQDHETLQGARSYPETSPVAIHNIADRLSSLQRSLSRRISATGSDLQPCWDRSTAVSSYSFSTNSHIDGLAVAFLRPRAQAAMIEKMMGRGATGIYNAQSYRHPVMELRVTPEHIAIELVMSPYAWWDQRNFTGKMGIERHREAFRSLLCEGNESLYMGFWSGANLCDAHLTCRQILRGQFLEEWFGTFAPEHDWFRLGAWYEPEHHALTQENILNELSRRAVALSKLYKFFAWTSENNFHGFVNNNSPATTGRRATQNGYGAV